MWMWLNNMYYGLLLSFAWASLVAQLVKSPPAMQETWFDSWRRDRLPTLVFSGFPGGSDGKEFACNVGDLGSIPGLGRSPGGGHGNPLQYYGLENPMDRGACFQGGTCISLSVLLKCKCSAWTLRNLLIFCSLWDWGGKQRDLYNL